MGKLTGMPRWLNGRLKYLFLVPIALLIGFIWLYHNALADIQRQNTADKLAEKRAAIELISDAADEQADIDIMLEKLAGMNDAFVMRYDCQLTSVFNRTPSPGNMPIDPVRFPAFVGAVTRGESGEMEIPYGDGRSVYLCYGWTRQDRSAQSRSLLVIGVLPADMSGTYARLTTGFILMIITTFIINTAFVILLSHLGYIYASRNCPKWRQPL